MESLTPLINGALLAIFTGVFAWLAKGRFDRLEAVVSELRTMIMQLAIAVGVQNRPRSN